MIIFSDFSFQQLQYVMNPMKSSNGTVPTTLPAKIWIVSTSYLWKTSLVAIADLGLLGMMAIVFLLIDVLNVSFIVYFKFYLE